MNGWIKLHRQFTEWGWYTDEKTKSVFIHCLLLANVEEKEWRGVIIPRGSFITSIENISSGINISVQSVRTALDKLRRTNEITIKSTSHYSMITICKYSTYQDNDKSNQQPDNIPSTSHQHPINIPSTTTKEGKNIRKKEGKNNIAADESAALYSRFIDLYNNFIENKTGAPAKINGKQGKFAKIIIAYFKDACLKKNPLSGDAEILASWSWILENYDKWDNFHKSQLDLSQIESNLVNIINHIKNGKPRITAGKRPATSEQQVINIVHAAFSAGNIPV